MKAAEKLGTAKLEGTDAAADGELLAPPAAHPIMETLAALLKVVQGTMSHKLSPRYKEYIARYKTNLANLHDHMKKVCDLTCTYTWKEHVLLVHLEEWLDDNKRGMAPFSEQASESIHKMHHKRSWAHYKLPVGHKNFAKHVMLSVVKTSSSNIGWNVTDSTDTE